MKQFLQKTCFLCLFVLMGMSASAYGLEVDGIYYAYGTEPQTVSVTSGDNQYSGSVNIPENVVYNGVTYSVTSIGDRAFWNCSGLTSVTIPNSVTSIGDKAFLGCSDLTSATIPNSVTYIGNTAFWDCSGLTSITVESGNTIYDSRKGCNAIIETASNTLIVGCQNTVIPNSVTSIGYQAFRGCSGLTSLTIPNSVTSIGGYAFSGCSGLTSVTIPNSVTSIGNGAFYGCSDLASVTIPNSVTSIGDYAFYSCSGLTSVTVESGNTVYDSREGCNAIIETASNTLIVGCQNTVILNSVTSIGDRAFYNCSGLTSVTIPNSVTSIGYQAFWGCSSLKTVISLIEEPFDIDSWVFYGIPTNVTLYVPQSTREKYQALSGWTDRFANIEEMPYNYDVITLNDAGMGTYCSEYGLDFTNVSGLKAYIASGFNPEYGTVLMTRVKEVPAGTGIVLMRTTDTASAPAEFEVPHTSTLFSYANLLVGTQTEQALPIEEGYTNYILTDGDEGVKFYKANSGTIGANKAYLRVPYVSPEVAPSRLQFIFDDETTGIEQTMQDNRRTAGDALYNLNGQRVDHSRKGIYIKGGKKIVVR